MGLKVIIAGSRIFNDQKILNTYLKRLINGYGLEISEIVSGTAQGADLMGENFAKENNLAIKRFPAKWNDLTVENVVIGINSAGKKYNKIAGHQRNEEMAKYADALVAFNVDHSAGTNNMIQLATKYGLKVYSFDLTINKTTKQLDFVSFNNHSENNELNNRKTKKIQNNQKELEL